MNFRHVSPFDQWRLNSSGQVVGVQLTDSNVASLFSFGGIVDSLQFSLIANITPEIGELTWSDEDETFIFKMPTNVVHHVGQETLYHVENHTGVTIPKGTLVQFAGTSGNSGKLRIAPWNGTQPSFTVMGLTASDIPNGGDTGFVLHFGKVRGIQTNGANYGESWSNGDVLYAGASGGLTKTPPAAPSSKTTVAAVVSAHPNNGTLFVRPQIGSNLGNDELVELGALASRDVIQYNAASNRFENGPPVLTAPASATPDLNRDVVFELASNTSLVVKVKGADGVVRSATITLA